MQTTFTPEQLADPEIARSNRILRNCVHCGFCTATCPTYQILGDELDSPRGRIYLIKEMLESGRPADEKVVKHVDRCLSCLACMTTCPSGVDYMHLVDHARVYIERTYRRPWHDRALRRLLSAVLPYPTRFRLALFGARLARPLAGLVPDRRLRAMLAMAPRRLPSVSRNDDPQVFPPATPAPATPAPVPPTPVLTAPATPVAETPAPAPPAAAAASARPRRVAILTGCAQRALNTDITDAAIRLLTRLGAEVVVVKGVGCCGALDHHMGHDDAARRHAGAGVTALIAEREARGLDAFVITTSGCGTVVKDYGSLFEGQPLARAAAEVAAMARDITEVVGDLLLEGRGAGASDRPVPRAPEPLRVAYHSACSLQHGQKIRSLPKELLRDAGFEVSEPENAHLCCGSAGTYNLLQPELSSELRRRKVGTIEALGPDVIAAGNIGCMVQIGAGTGLPVVHTVELLDWATGGPRPAALSRG